jgi:O-antigen/teichoic acid export membrane protein
MSLPYSGTALKKSLVHFFGGKAISAALTFALLILLARKLGAHDYGAYATLIAILELGYALSNMGLSWVIQRYIPEYRIHANTQTLQKFMWQLLTLRALTGFVFSILLYLASVLFAQNLHLETYGLAVSIYIIVMFFEGLGRSIRDDMLGALLQQKIAQTGLIVRNLILLLLVALFADSFFELKQLAWMELAASIIATTLSVFWMLRHISGLTLIGNSTWQAPSTKQMLITARAMQASFLLTLATSQQAFMLIVNALLGLQAAAIFGFARNLNDFLRRYLPAELLMGLIRPKLIADFTQHHDMERLVRHALFTWKLSLAVLAPALGFFIMSGEQLASLISANKYPQAGAIIAGLAISLIPFSQQRILETLANVIGHPEACVKASAWSLLAIPTLILLISAGTGLWAVVVAISVAEISFNFSLLRSIKNANCPYKIELTMMVKLGALIIASAISLLPFVNLTPTWLVLGIESALVGLVALSLGWFIGFFSDKERTEMRSFLKPKPN